MSADPLPFLARKGLQLSLLTDEHLIDFFTCGRDERLDRWLSSTAKPWQNEDMCTVWILTRSARTEVLGYLTLSSQSIIPTSVERRVRATDPKNRAWVNNLQSAMPATLLGKFAVHEREQGTGLGAVLMACTYSKHVQAASLSGSKFLILDVHNEQLLEYYSAWYGFLEATDQGALTRLLRPTSAIRRDVTALLS